MPLRTNLTLCVALLLAPLPLCAWRAGPNSPLGSPLRFLGDKTPDLDETTRLLVEGTNSFRKQEHQPELKESSRLAKTARDFAAFMARTDKYGHEADGSQPAERVKKHGYEYCVVAENIAYEFSSEGFTTDELARGFLDGWKKSPGHRKNMLDPEVMEVGMAVAHSEQSDRYYAVQVFARPRSVAFSFEIVNESGLTIEYQLGDEALTLEPRYTRTHEVCIPAALKFAWKEAEGKPETFQPGRGDRFVVTREQGKFRVSRQAPGKKEPDDVRGEREGS